MAEFGEEKNVNGGIGTTGNAWGNTSGSTGTTSGENTWNNSTKNAGTVTSGSTWTTVNGNIGTTPTANAGSIRTVKTGKELTKAGFWDKFKAFWLQEIDWNKEIKVELTPYEQKVEDEINEFLHQEVTWEKVHGFLFQEITFGKSKASAK